MIRPDPRARRAPLHALALLGIALHAAAAAGAVDRPYEVTEEREACASYEPLRRPLFGDTHVHTGYSLDARAQDNRSTPRDAYAFAKGAPLGLAPYMPDGQPMRHAALERPLDFTVVTDHSEALGEVRACYDPGNPGYDSDMCEAYRNLGGITRSLMLSKVLIERGRFRFCGEDAKYCREAHASAWRDIQEAAEEAYDRTSQCRFTSFVGYEYTASSDAGINLHRNVVFRNENVTDTAISWTDTGRASELWKRLRSECLEGTPGCDVLTIPHNSNLSSNGLMFASGTLRSKADAAVPITPEDARERARFEPLVEIMQHKGDSECLLGGDTTDEGCGFEKLPYDSFAGVRQTPNVWHHMAPKRSAMVREALRKGLAVERRVGANPFKYGIVASTDTHLGTPGLTEEYQPYGHGGAGGTAGEGGMAAMGLPDELEYNPGGLAVVWAEENTRDAIFAAMLRKETYGTSGTRPVVRFFGGWGYGDDLCGADDLVARGYAGGVPMGGDLPPPPADAKAPAFAVSAMMDPGTSTHPGTPLDGIEVVKGWVDADGETHERVFRVASGPPGATVDTATCERRGGGARSLCTVWRDPEFDPDASAFYYARVTESPSCRWSQYVCRAHAVDCAKPESIPMGYEACCSPLHDPVIQERAWTSPIWYAPSR
ncbi:MAG: DUF3604 domain-containing protein [Myxococcales bacterium]|nr:DUF3604 domain-containing protein [Myxococcales bacterium]